jgi:hypothetical protein
MTGDPPSGQPAGLGSREAATAGAAQPASRTRNAPKRSAARRSDARRFRVGTCMSAACGRRPESCDPPAYLWMSLEESAPLWISGVASVGNRAQPHGTGLGAPLSWTRERLRARKGAADRRQSQRAEQSNRIAPFDRLGAHVGDTASSICVCRLETADECVRRQNGPHLPS